MFGKNTVTTCQCYVICATPRTGSTLLCDLLESTGVAGRPDSYFRRQSIACWARHLGIGALADQREFDRAYLAAVLREGAAGTGLFGLRLMWETVAELSARLDTLYPGLPDDAARIERAFGATRYIHLSRQDKIAQAVSRLKAEQTGLWHTASDGSERERLAPPGPPAYDPDRLTQLVAEISVQDEAWERWFAQHRIAPVRVTYEKLAADHKRVLAKVLSALGLDPAIAANVDTRTAKMADDESREWADRYRASRGSSPP